MSNDDNAFPEFRGTAYNLLNAIVEYADHRQGVRITKNSLYDDPQLQRSENALIGSGDALKQVAYERIIQLTDGSEVIEPVYYSIPTEEKPSATSLLDSIIDNTGK